MAISKSTQTVSDFIVKALELHGVEYVFGVPGEETEDLLFSLSRSKQITFIPTRHEQGAAFMANVWGRLTGKVGVCLSTLGPGATNLVTGLADAFMDKAPVLALTGQADSKRLHKESHQYIDVVALMRPISKWNTLLHTPHITAEVVSKALRIAETEKPGVTHIDIPEDIAHTAYHGVPIEIMKVRRGAPDYKAIEKAVALLQKSERPIILAGNGAIRKRAAKQLRLLSSIYNIPVVSTFMGKGAVSDLEVQSLYTAGMKAKDIPAYALEKADLVIAVGYDIAEYDPSFWNRKDTRPIVHIDFESSETYEYYQPTVEIVADVSAALWELSRVLEEQKMRVFDSWYLSYRTKMSKDIASYSKEPKIPTVPYVVSVLRDHMPTDAILLSDVGSHKMWIGRNFPVYEPGTCIISNGLASMGIALPGGMAAKLAYPERKVVSVMGDGGFLMNSQEIETAKRMKVPFVIVILNDNDYGLISWKQTTHRGSAVGTKLTNPDFRKYAESFGIKAYTPKTAKEVKRDLKKAIDGNELCVVAIDIDPRENMKLTKKLQSLTFK
jgi:acetolactate synthase-1/2/3 large subunit